MDTETNTMLKEDWDAYNSYNNTLRAWFVAFGVGLPATFLINDDLVKYISPKEGSPEIIICFFLGVGAQVLMSFVNKTINWCNYYSDNYLDSNADGLWRELPMIISKATNWYIIDFVFDLLSIALFTVALWKLFNAMIS